MSKAKKKRAGPPKGLVDDDAKSKPPAVPLKTGAFKLPVAGLAMLKSLSMLTGETQADMLGEMLMDGLAVRVSRLPPQDRELLLLFAKLTHEERERLDAATKHLPRLATKDT